MPPKRRHTKSKRPPAASRAGSSSARSSTSPGGSLSRSDVKSQLQRYSFKDRGNAAFRLDHFSLAVNLYTQGLDKEKAPRMRSHLLANRSAVYCVQEKWKSALRDAYQCAQLAPTWAKAHFRIGEALRGQLKYSEALKAYRKGLVQDPHNKLLKTAVAEVEETLQSLGISEHELLMQQDPASFGPSERKANSSSGSVSSSQLPHPDEDKFARMIRWMHNHGAKFPLLYMRYYSEDYRGVHALAKIPYNTTVLYVPHNLIMTSEVAKASKICQKITKAGYRMQSKHSYLASYLLQEKRDPHSFWKPYIDILPRKYRNMPIFFNEEELKWLKGSFSLQKIADRKESLREEYDNICSYVPEYKEYPYEDFVWARLVVITRIFGLMINGEKTDGLVPYADMLNHRRPKETKWSYEDDDKGFNITTLKTMQLGDEVFDSYGRKCNSRFFVNYGFSIDENEDNEVVIHIDVPANTEYPRQKQHLVGGVSRLPRQYQVPANHNERKTLGLFAFLRFVNLEGPDELTYFPRTYGDIEEVPPVSIRNEKAALSQLKTACQSVLAGFETSLDWDMKWLEQPREKLDNNIRNCVVMRAGEKKVLHWFIGLADRAIAMLDMPLAEFNSQLELCKKGLDKFDHYATTVLKRLRRR